MSVFRTAMVWLGLVDDDEYDAQEDEYYLGEEYEEPAREPAKEPARVAPAARAAQPESSQVTVFRGRNVRDDDEQPVAAAARSSAVKTIPMPTTRVHVMDPRGFNDAQEVGDRLKANQPVILNLQGLPRELQRRLIDFSSGLAYAVAGNMQRVANQVFLLTPSNVEVSQEEKDRLQARGLFQP